MHERTRWTQAAVERLLRPIVRLALGLGLKHAQLEEVLREVLVDEARRLWRSQGVERPNLSQLAVTTGLHRKDVTARVRATRDPLPATEASAAARAYTAWLQLVLEDPQARRLPLADTGDGPSFELVARLATRGNVHHRAVLEELLRLGMVREQGDAVELTADGFVPSSSLRDMLAFLGDNGRDHLLAAVSNTLGQQPRMLERSVFANGLTAEECERLHALARRHWDSVHYRLVREMTDSVRRSEGQGQRRMRVGIYTYHEDEATDSDAASPSPSQGDLP